MTIQYFEHEFRAEYYIVFSDTGEMLGGHVYYGVFRAMELGDFIPPQVVISRIAQESGLSVEEINLDSCEIIQRKALSVVISDDDIIRHAKAVTKTDIPVNIE